jgi:uncharacterized membrane protein
MIAASSRSELIRAQRLRRDVWLCFLLLCVHQLLWYCWLRPPEKVSPLVPLAFAFAPLLPGIIGYLTRYRYALILAGVAVLWHFIIATMLAVIQSKDWIPALMQSVICTLFFLIWYKIVRVEKQAIKARATAQSGDQ